MTESGHSSIALIIADMPSPPHVSDFELCLVLTETIHTLSRSWAALLGLAAHSERVHE